MEQLTVNTNNNNNVVALVISDQEPFHKTTKALLYNYCRGEHRIKLRIIQITWQCHKALGTFGE